MISRKTLLFVMIISFGVNIMEATSSSAYYRGFMVKSIANKLTKKSKEKSKLEKICQTKIFNISSKQTFVEESCMRPAIYLTQSQQVIRLFAVVCVWVLFISACCNMDDRRRGETTDFICGMIVADFIDSVFDHD
jgi:hypothetical protein